VPDLHDPRRRRLALDKSPRPAAIVLAEFCNVYEEIHALAFGLIHSCIRLRPLGYSEIAEEDFSPELIADLQHEYHYYRAAFWAPRIVVALADPRGHRQPGDG